MRCPNCNFPMKEGEMVCRKCGYAIQLVPDYAPREDHLEEGAYKDKRTGKMKRRDRTKNISERGQNRVGAAMGTASRRSDEKRRKQMARKQRLKKRRRRFLLSVFCLLLLFILGGFGFYQITYRGLVGRGYKAFHKKDYDKAKQLFQKAIKKKEEKPGAYAGMAKVYTAEGEKEKAESMFRDVLKKQPKNPRIYEALIDYYRDVEETGKIPKLLDEAEGSVVKKLKGYVLEKPKFSLDDSKVYDDVQELTLEAKKGETIRYTTDGKAPTLKSKKYEGAIQLKEGETVVIAIAVDKRNIPSLPQKKTYKVEFPIEAAPAVSPSTGQYSEAKKIEIKVPEGYEAYYTLDKSEPTTSSFKYTEPIDMPEGETLFKAVLVNKKGKMSGVTTRNYLLEPGK